MLLFLTEHMLLLSMYFNFISSFNSLILDSVMHATMARTPNKKQKFVLEDSGTSRQQPHSDFCRTLLILTLNCGYSY